MVNANGDSEQRHLKPAILVVDDDPDVLRLVDTVLSHRGYRVLTAKGADVAIRAFEQLRPRPDVVLADVVMPGMSGPALADYLLADSPDLCVLFMSAYDERQVVQRYVVEKGFDLIPKPFHVQDLVAYVETALEKQFRVRTP